MMCYFVGLECDLQIEELYFIYKLKLYLNVRQICFNRLLKPPNSKLTSV